MAQIQFLTDVITNTACTYLSRFFIPIVVLIGFARTYYLKRLFGTPPLPGLLVHLQGIVMSSWVAGKSIASELIRRGILFLLLVVFALPSFALFSRTQMTLRNAWANPNVLIIKGRVSQARYEERSAYYTVLVSEVLKPRGGLTLSEITVIDPSYRSTASINLKASEDVALFVQEEADHSFQSHREFNLDESSDALGFRGVGLFLRLMYVSDEVAQRQQSLDSWDARLSDPEKLALLDVMWETRYAGYADALVDIAEGRDSPGIRSCAITILAYLEVTRRSEELVPILDEPDYEIRRQLLLLFGMHRVKAALPRIQKLLKENIVTEAAWQAEELKSVATQAMDKITGKNMSPYWK